CIDLSLFKTSSAVRIPSKSSTTRLLMTFPPVQDRLRKGIGDPGDQAVPGVLSILPASIRVQCATTTSSRTGVGPNDSTSSASGGLSARGRAANQPLRPNQQPSRPCPSPGPAV